MILQKRLASWAGLVPEACTAAAVAVAESNMAEERTLDAPGAAATVGASRRKQVLNPGGNRRVCRPRQPSSRHRGRGGRTTRQEERDLARGAIDEAGSSQVREGLRLRGREAPEGFEQEEWELMYPRFIECGLIRDGYFYL